METNNRDDDCPDIMDLPLHSEYELMKSIDVPLFEKIIIESLLIKKRSNKRGKLDINSNGSLMTMSSEDWMKINQSIHILNRDHEIKRKTESPMRFKAKRTRKNFTKEQIAALGKEFAKCQYPSQHECDQIAEALQLSRKRVICWFKSRRMKKNNYTRSQSNDIIKNELRLRLVKEYEDMNDWSIFQNNTDGYFLVQSESSLSCHGKDFESSLMSFQEPPKSSPLSMQKQTINKNDLKDPRAQIDNSTVKPPRLKKTPTKFNPKQLFILEKAFSITQNINAQTRHELAHILNISDKTVKNWFDNRRRRERQQTKKISSETKITTNKEIAKRCQQFGYIDTSSLLEQEHFDPSSSSSFTSLVDDSKSPSSHSISNFSNLWHQQDYHESDSSKQILKFESNFAVQGIQQTRDDDLGREYNLCYPIWG